MKLYFLGIGGTLMGNLALLAREAGHDVRGSDEGLYPPMSTVLSDAGIPIEEGWDERFLSPRPDLVVMGNAGLPRGHPGVEAVLDANIPFVSGAEWLGRHLLGERHVLAVSGTHGKTTTTAMLAWILEHAGLEPGYLVGGVPANFPQSARVGTGPFVVEADEYDCSYFDRRSKFVHYHPNTLILNNLEYDHADIFEDLDAIQRQFHNLMRTLPASGRVVAPRDDAALDDVLARGCWTPIERFSSVALAADARTATERASRLHEQDSGLLWHPVDIAPDGRSFTVQRGSEQIGRVEWTLLGAHNAGNALAAIAAAEHAGVEPAVAVEALSSFLGVKRRMELIYEHDGIRVYDDFAHHPTAIRSTLQGLRAAVGAEHVTAIIEPRSHTMSLGTLRNELATCCAPADEAIWFRTPRLTWDLSEVVSSSVVPARMADDVDRLARTIETDISARPAGAARHVVIMSNGSFGGLHTRLRERLRARFGGD